MEKTIRTGHAMLHASVEFGLVGTRVAYTLRADGMLVEHASPDFVFPNDSKNVVRSADGVPSAIRLNGDDFPILWA